MVTRALSRKRLHRLRLRSGCQTSMEARRVSEGHPSLTRRASIETASKRLSVHLKNWDFVETREGESIGYSPPVLPAPSNLVRGKKERNMRSSLWTAALILGLSAAWA